MVDQHGSPQKSNEHDDDRRSPYTVPWANRLARWALRPIFRGLFHLLGPVVVTGKEHVPKHGPYIISFNHVSIYEAPLVVAFWPTAPEVMGAVEIWSRKGQDVLARLYHGIPVHRGEYDRVVLDRVLHVLRSGKPLIVAPEGGRTHAPGMRRAYPGVAYLMDKAAVPVVPVGVVGTTEDYFDRAKHLKRPVLEMHIGKPFLLPPLSGSGEERRINRQRNADTVMLRIAELLPPDYRGVYNHPEQLKPIGIKDQQAHDIQGT